jgi:hypothetical protein
LAKDAARAAPSPWGEGRDEGGHANQFRQCRRCEIFVAREFNFFPSPLGLAYL